MKVFISHPFVDEKLAAILLDTLKEQGINAYMAQRVKEYELKIDKKVIQEILDSDYVVAIITKNTRESASVNQELGFAQGKNVPRIAMIEKNAKVGVLLYGIDYEEFTRDNFGERCKDVRTYLKSKGTQKKISDEDRRMLKQEVYIPLYDKLMRFVDSSHLTEIPPNPWENIKPHQILKVDQEIKRLFDEYSNELGEWKKMFLAINDGYETNKNVLGNIIAPAFLQAKLLKPDGMIILDEHTSQHPPDFIDAFKVIVFDNTIIDGKSLLTKLKEHCDLTNNGAKRYLQFWEQNHPQIFDLLAEKLPELWKKIRIEKLTHSELRNKREILRGKISYIVSMLEEKIKE